MKNKTMTDRATVSDVLLEALHGLGVEYLFANLGTDYPPIIEAMARRSQAGNPAPTMLLCPHENTAITAAHGYFLGTGRGQGVFVHVGVGTQNLGGSLANAATGRVPMFIFAGRSPVTTRGERLGSRDNPIHYFQDVRDQAGVIRQFTKWEFNLELPEQITYAVHRARRLMESDPKGLVYMTAAREVLAMPAPERGADPFHWGATPSLGRISDETARSIAERLAAAQRPLLITSYAGRNKGAVDTLVQLSETLAMPVLEAGPMYLNFPRGHENHWGFLPVQGIAEADLILLVDTDVPWLSKTVMPRPDTPVIQLDLDPLKPHITMWDFPVTESYQTDTDIALASILTHAKGLDATALDAKPDARREWTAKHRFTPPPPSIDNGKLTARSLSALLGEVLPPETVFFDEGITNTAPIREGTRRTVPGTYFGITGGSLGWGGGAAMGYKLARPEAEVVLGVGDGSFLFSVPSSLYLTARRYKTPFLTVIYNNSGWNAVRTASLRVYGEESEVARSGDFQHDFPSTANLEDIAGACGCHTGRADSIESMQAALEKGRKAVKKGQCAVINAMISDP
ncbi:MAG: thiamine pyrophosphate-requiring protein [SAR324 cluster bacterium]|nr:thiamine pyrophosphate-requiring protein [SAR324 cluster bacterium]